MNLLPFPRPQACSSCEHKFVGAVCPLCGTERAAFTALKRITARAHHGVPALRDPQTCRYFPESICGCGGRGACLPAA